MATEERLRGFSAWEAVAVALLLASPLLACGGRQRTDLRIERVQGDSVPAQDLDLGELDRLPRVAVEPLSLPGECAWEVSQTVTVIEDDEALAQHLRCPPSATPHFDFQRRRIIVAMLDSDTRLVGHLLDEERGAILVHTRHRSYPRGTPPERSVDAYTLPADGPPVQHLRETIVTGERVPGRDVPSAP